MPQLFMLKNNRCEAQNEPFDDTKARVIIHFLKNSEHRMVALVHDRFIIISPAERKQTERTAAKSPRWRFACLCVLPLVVVTAGAVLVGIGMGFWPPSAIEKDILTTAGIAVYIFGVIYFVIINLVDQSCEQEEENDLSTSETVDTELDNETLAHEIEQGDCVTLV